jgi:hypothetical protein
MFDRRTLLSLTAAAPLAALAPARRACAQPPAFAAPLPARPGALDWRILLSHASQGGWAAPVQLSREVLALNRTTVEVDGFFLPYVPVSSPVFLLTPYSTHCEGCVPEKPFSVLGVSARSPRDDGEGVLAYRGTFVIAPDNPSGYPFWLLDAEAVGA